MVGQNLVVRDESVSITVVESEDGVHRAEIYRNALGQYSIHQTRRVSDGRLIVQATGWDELNSLDDMLQIAAIGISTQLELDAEKPDRHRDSVAGLREHHIKSQRLAVGNLGTEGIALERIDRAEAKAERTMGASPPQSRLCGHPTKGGPCGHRVTSSGPCAAGHPQTRK